MNANHLNKSNCNSYANNHQLYNQLNVIFFAYGGHASNASAKQCYNEILEILLSIKQIKWFCICFSFFFFPVNFFANTDN